MILADGSTFTELKGCTIADVPDDCDDPCGMGYPVLAEFEPSDNNKDIIIWQKDSLNYFALQIYRSAFKKGT